MLVHLIHQILHHVPPEEAQHHNEQHHPMDLEAAPGPPAKPPEPIGVLLVPKELRDVKDLPECMSHDHLRCNLGAND